MMNRLQAVSYDEHHYSSDLSIDTPTLRFFSFVTYSVKVHIWPEQMYKSFLITVVELLQTVATAV
jgi:hypothetical protein